MKKIIAFLTCVLITAAFCSCEKSADTVTKTETESESANTAQTEPITTEADTEDNNQTEPIEGTEAAEQTAVLDRAPSGSLSDDWTSFQAELNGTVYTLPALFSEFAANGWEGDDWEDMSETLNPNQYTLGTILKNGNTTVYSQIVNFDVNVLAMSDCYVGLLEIDESDAKKGVVLILPGGITIGSTLEEVRAAYGDPTDTYESEYYIEWTYEQQRYSEVEINFDPETKIANKICIRNLNPKDPPKPSAVQTGETPDSVKNYKAPSELGTDYKTFNVKYDGDLYTLPAPVSVFVENGWKIIDTGVTVPARGFKVGFQISKNNITLRTSLQNYSDTEQPAENCFVTLVGSDVYDLKIPLELPGGITINSTREDIKKAYGEPDAMDDTHYQYGNVFRDVKFFFFGDTGEMTGITVDHSPKELGY